MVAKQDSQEFNHYQSKYRSGVKVAALVLETNVFVTCGFESHLRY